MELKNPTKDALEVWQDGQRTLVDAGGVIEAAGDQARQLQAQGWGRADKPKARDNDTAKDDN